MSGRRDFEPVTERIAPGRAARAGAFVVGLVLLTVVSIGIAGRPPAPAGTRLPEPLAAGPAAVAAAPATPAATGLAAPTDSADADGEGVSGGFAVAEGVSRAADSFRGKFPWGIRLGRYDMR